MVPDVGLSSVFKGVMPFALAMLVILVLLIAFPSIVTLLPSMAG
jgi:TRAP-type mannitol/chloroaromatic compound transport system permease large subunit